MMTLDWPWPFYKKSNMERCLNKIFYGKFLKTLALNMVYTVVFMRRLRLVRTRCQGHYFTFDPELWVVDNVKHILKSYEASWNQISCRASGGGGIKICQTIQVTQLLPGRVAQSLGYLTRKSEVLGSIPSLASYFRFSFRWFKRGSCQLLAKVCARSTG